MGPRERVAAALRGEPVAPVPVGAVTQSATFAQMEATGARWAEAHRDARAMAALAEAAHAVMGFDMARVPFDQTIEAEVLRGEGDRRGVVLEALRLLSARTPAAVLGGVVGPFTIACQVQGVASVIMDALRRPESLAPLLDRALTLAAEYARLQVEAGAQAIVVEDMSASLDLTSPRMYRDLILSLQQRLIGQIPAPVILHICGGNTKILDAMVRAGAAALSLEDRTDLAAAARATVTIGGIPPVEVLLHGTPADVRHAARASLDAGVRMLAPGCGIPPEAPTANLRAMVEAAHEYHAARSAAS